MEALFGFLLLAWFVFFFYYLDSSSKFIYWICLLAIYAQSLFWFFHFNLLSSATSIEWVVWEIDDEFTASQQFFLLLSIFPFMFPIFLAWLTGAITENFSVGLVVFSFFSIVEVMVRGKMSGQVDWSNKIASLAKMILPIFSLLAAIINMVNKLV